MLFALLRVFSIVRFLKLCSGSFLLLQAFFCDLGEEGFDLEQFHERHVFLRVFCSFGELCQEIFYVDDLLQEFVLRLVTDFDGDGFAQQSSPDVFGETAAGGAVEPVGDGFELLFGETDGDKALGCVIFWHGWIRFDEVPKIKVRTGEKNSKPGFFMWRIFLKERCWLALELDCAGPMPAEIWTCPNVQIAFSSASIASPPPGSQYL